MMEFRVLGPLEVRRDDRAVALAGAKPRAVLAMLLLHANEPVRAERLAVALFGEDAPPAALGTVRVYVSRLRRAVGDEGLVATSRAGYRLRVRPGELDLERFERLVRDGRRALAEGRAERAAGMLREALELWRGPPLADLASEPFAPAHIARLEEERLEALEARVEADLASGRDAELVSELHGLVGEHPLRERLHAQLMLALYRSGRQADALHAYRRARAVLVEQLGIEPADELRRLERGILAQDPRLLVDAPARPAAVPATAPGVREGARPRRIPAPPTATVGRKAELERLRAMLGDAAVRHVTLVGPPGVGKTRLAIEAGRALAGQLRDGAVFVSLAAVGDFEHVGSTIARELDVTAGLGESALDALVRRLEGRELLLVLDNFEHVLDAAPFVAELLAATAEVTVLATSREPLRLRAERLFHVDPLALPAPSDTYSWRSSPAPAVELFIDVARARDPAFDLDDADAPAIVEVCRRLDGLPLAIELAAGRLGLLSAPELAARLRAGLGALGAGPRDAPSRQRTLEAALEWSYALLSAAEQQALVALGVFAGGCSIEAARAVTQAPLEALEALVAKNLASIEAAAAGTTRLRLLRTVREFARSRLAQTPDAHAVHRRHCEHYLAVAEQVRPQLERANSRAQLAALDAELENIRSALRWSLDNSPVLALRLASALLPYWWARALFPEAVDWLTAGLANADDVPASVRADALGALGFSLGECSRATDDRAEAAARASLELYREEGNLSGCARSTNILATLLIYANRTAEARRFATEGERLAIQAADAYALIWSRWNRTMTAPTVEEALALGEQIAAVHRALGNDIELAKLHSSLTYQALIHGSYTAAQRLSREALDAARALGDPLVLAAAHCNAGLVALHTGQLQRAEQAFLEELRLMGRRGYAWFLFDALIGLAAVAASERRDRIAATLVGAARASSTDVHHPAIARQLEERFFAPAKRRLGDAAWNATYAAGARLDRSEAIETALQNVRLRVAV